MKILYIHTCLNMCWWICCGVKKCIFGDGDGGGGCNWGVCCEETGMGCGCWITFDSCEGVNGGGWGRFDNNSVCSVSFCNVDSTFLGAADDAVLVIAAVLLFATTKVTNYYTLNLFTKYNNDALFFDSTSSI